MGDPEATQPYALEFNAIVDGIAEGKVVFFLGAGVNLCDRPDGAEWQPGTSDFLPSGYELATHIAAKFKYPFPERDLARVCQFVVEFRGLAPLYSHLHELFSAPCEPNQAHRFLAQLPAYLRAKRYPDPNLFILTTNYDDLVESAFAKADEPLQVVTYVADDPQNRGRFLHRLANGERKIITRPNEYRDVSPTQGSVLLKIHGAVDRLTPGNDSYVIAEDHYIDFLARADISNIVPVLLAAKLRASHFLFLGYSLRDWNLRVILQRIWDEQRLGYNSWGVQRNPDTVDRRFWSRRNVEILELSLSDCIGALETRLEALPNWEE